MCAATILAVFNRTQVEADEHLEFDPVNYDFLPRADGGVTVVPAGEVLVGDDGCEIEWDDEFIFTWEAGDGIEEIE